MASPVSVRMGAETDDTVICEADELRLDQNREHPIQLADRERHPWRTIRVRIADPKSRSARRGVSTRARVPCILGSNLVRTTRSRTAQRSSIPIASSGRHSAATRRARGGRSRDPRDRAQREAISDPRRAHRLPNADSRAAIHRPAASGRVRGGEVRRPAQSSLVVWRVGSRSSAAVRNSKVNARSSTFGEIGRSSLDVDGANHKQVAREREALREFPTATHSPSRRSSSGRMGCRDSMPDRKSAK